MLDMQQRPFQYDLGIKTQHNATIVLGIRVSVQIFRQRFSVEFFLDTQEHNFPKPQEDWKPRLRREKDLFFVRNLRSETRIPNDLVTQSLRCAGF